MAGRSQGLLHWLLEAELASGRDNGQAVLQVVVDEVADAVKDPVFRPDLEGHRGQESMTHRWMTEDTCAQSQPGLGTWSGTSPGVPTLSETCL